MTKCSCTPWPRFEQDSYDYHVYVQVQGEPGAYSAYHLVVHVAIKSPDGLRLAVVHWFRIATRYILGLPVRHTELRDHTPDDVDVHDLASHELFLE